MSRGGTLINKDINLTELIVLVLKSVDGDIYNALINECKPIIYKAINSRFVSGLDEDDLFQEASIVLIESIKTYRFETDMRFQQYYSHCLINHFNSLGRKSMAKKRKSMTEAISVEHLKEISGIEIANDMRMKPEDPLDKAIAQETFYEYTSSLSPFELEVFMLYLKNYSLEKNSQSFRPRCKSS